MRQGLIIFIRNPVAGEVKTRLARTLGNEKALTVYEWLLSHTREITQELACDKFLYYSGAPELDDGWDNRHYFKKKTMYRLEARTHMRVLKRSPYCWKEK